MIARWDGQALLDPISAAQPCGQDLDDTPVLGTFDALRVFGQVTPLDAPPVAEQSEEGEREQAKARPPLEWDRIRADALEALGKSKDLRLLAYLGAALLRTDGLPAFAQVLVTASSWLEHYWAQVFPVVDEDAIARRNALNCLADPMAIVDCVWRLPLVVSRQHGRVSLRDMDILSGQVPGGPGEGRPDEGAVREAFKEMPAADLTALDESVKRAAAALVGIDVKMRTEGGADVVPDFAPLSAQFAKLNRICREQLALRSAGTVAGEAVGGAEGAEPGAAPAGLAGGAIRTRQDAIRALDAVAEFFRRNEPSSPIPLFVERAKRLVSKDFLEVLADIAPDALTTARSAGGLKPDQ